MRWLPKSLFSQLMLVLFAGLLIAQLAGFALHMHERRELLAQASGMQTAQRIADIVHLIDPMNAGERTTIAKVLSVPPLVLQFDRAPLATPSAGMNAGIRATMFGTLLRRFLGADHEIVVAVTRAASLPHKGAGFGTMAAGRDEAWPPWKMHKGQEPGYAFVAQVRLRDGALATFDTRLPRATASWPYRLLLSIALLFGAVLLVTYIAVRWTTRPLEVLAQAADELGKNINRSPMPESGPQEVARAARAFNTMQSRLASYVRERTQVLAAMSHDLKTLITRLRLRAELLDDAQQRIKFTRDLQEMEAMVTAALDFLRGMEDRETIQPVDVMALLESLQADLAETGGRVDLDGRVSEPYLGRTQALKRCIGNLLQNAINYGKRARVVVSDNTQRLQLTILDDGPGIPEQELENVFQPFYRLEGSRNRDTGGTGLGLAIARGVAEHHGGHLTLANRPEGGLEARLILPRKPAGQHD